MPLMSHFEQFCFFAKTEVIVKWEEIARIRPIFGVEWEKYLKFNHFKLALKVNKNIIDEKTDYLFTADEKDGFENIIRFQTNRGYPATSEGQMKMFANIMTIVCALPAMKLFNQP